MLRPFSDPCPKSGLLPLGRGECCSTVCGWCSGKSCGEIQGMAQSIVVPRDKLSVRERSRGGEEKEKKKEPNGNKDNEEQQQEKLSHTHFCVAAANAFIAWLTSSIGCHMQRSALYIMPNYWYPARLLAHLFELHICPFAHVLFWSRSKLKTPKSATIWIQISP